MNSWFVALLSLSSAQAFAAGPLTASPVQQDMSTERYANDLVGSDLSDRLYAARVLRRRVRTAWRLAGRNTDGFQVDEARQTLADFDLIVAPRCIRQLNVQNVRVPCADILGMLETKEALTALQVATKKSLRHRERKALEGAIRKIQGSQ